MADEYDFSAAVRRATAKEYADGSNVVVLDRDVAEIFRNAAAVNAALRMLARLAKQVSGQRGSKPGAKRGTKRRKR